MKEMVRYGFILSLICIVASAALAGVNSLTKSRIASQAAAEEEASFKEVLPGASAFEPVSIAEEVLYYKAYDVNKKFIGAVFRASAKGYSSVIETVAGISLDGKVTAVEVLSQNDTPGLGSRVTESGFLEQFKGKPPAGLDGVQAITGATISSSAVIKSVQEKAAKVAELLNNER